MSQLKAWASGFLRYIQLDLASFNEDYQKSKDSDRSLAVIKVQMRELEEIWSKISTRFEKIRESTLLEDPKEMAAISLDELTREYVNAKNFYRRRIVSLEEALDDANRSTAIKSSPVTPTTHTQDHGNSVSVTPCEMPIFSGDYKSWI